jgi:transcriptional regulator with XRE-family HTH domain
MNHETFAIVKNKTRIPATEIARRSKIDRTRLWLYETGAAQLSAKQLEALEAALVAVISERMKDFAAGIQLLKGQKKAPDGVGARVEGQKEPRCGEHSDQP